MDRYVLVEWPEIQDFMEHPRYNECYSGNSIDENNVTGAWFVPEDLYYEIEVGKMHSFEINLSNGERFKFKIDKITINAKNKNG